MSLPQDIKDRLLEHFGHQQLPADLAAIVESNPQARAFWDELHALDQALPQDDAFCLDDDDFADMLERVESEIDTTVERAHLRAITRPWYQVTAVAASIALMAVAVMLALKVQDPASTGMHLTTVAVEQTDNDSITLIEPNESTTAALISDYASRRNLEASAWLLDDLTDEEFEYLRKNLEVGDLL
jgi:hypothetical protein